MKRYGILVLALVLAFGAFAVVRGEDAPMRAGVGAGKGAGLGAPAAAAAAAASAESTLTDAEKAELLYMVEEEKLARDVYVKMFELWGVRSFAMIARAETRHAAALRNVLKLNGIADPTANAAAGKFTDTKLQALYDSLVKKGSESVAAALAVGATIEDLDIADLEDAKAGTKNAVLTNAYDNLLRGSENHLRAFVGQIKQAGGNYVASYITAERLAAIVAADAVGGPNGSRIAAGARPGSGMGIGAGRRGAMGRGPGRAAGCGQTMCGSACMGAARGTGVGRPQGMQNRAMMNSCDGTCNGTCDSTCTSCVAVTESGATTEPTK